VGGRHPAVEQDDRHPPVPRREANEHLAPPGHHDDPAGKERRDREPRSGVEAGGVEPPPHPPQPPQPPRAPPAGAPPRPPPRGGRAPPGPTGARAEPRPATPHRRNDDRSESSRVAIDAMLVTTRIRDDAGGYRPRTQTDPSPNAISCAPPNGMSTGRSLPSAS